MLLARMTVRARAVLKSPDCSASLVIKLASTHTSAFATTTHACPNRLTVAPSAPEGKPKPPHAPDLGCQQSKLVGSLAARRATRELAGRIAPRHKDHARLRAASPHAVAASHHHMPMPVGAAPSRAAASAPIKTREEVLEAVKSGAFPLKDNERDSLRNPSRPSAGARSRSLYTLLILPLALTRIVLFIVVFTSTGCTAALAACLPARSCGRRCLLAIAMRGIRSRPLLFRISLHQTDRKTIAGSQNHLLQPRFFCGNFYLTPILTPCYMAEIETVLTQRPFLNFPNLTFVVDGVVTPSMRPHDRHRSRVS